MAALKAIVTANATVENGGREVKRLRLAATARTGRCAPIAAMICAAFLESIAVTGEAGDHEICSHRPSVPHREIRAGPQILIAAHPHPATLTKP
jgi:hypothetical protein